MRYEPEKWKSAYQDDGFVIVQDLLNPSTLSALLDGMDKITGYPRDLPPHLKEKIFLERDHVKNNPQWYTGSLTPEECGNSVRQIADLASVSLFSSESPKPRGRATVYATGGSTGIHPIKVILQQM